MRKAALLLLLALFCGRASFAQVTEEEVKDEKASKIASATDFSVPSSPAFILLDATPAKVNKPSFARDFKLDWIFNGTGIAPNIAIEAQPIWLFGFKNKSYSEYQRTAWVLKQLSTLSISVGTVKKDTIQSLAWGAKLNIFREKRGDPMENREYIDGLKELISFSPHEKALLLRLNNYKDELNDLPDDSISRRAALEDKIAVVEDELKQMGEESEKEIKAKKKAFADHNWNASMIDIGYGNVYNYFGESIDKLALQQHYSGIWLNASYNFGSDKVLLSGLYKYQGGDSAVHYIGGNIRYGNSKINAFVEYVHETKSEVRRNTIAYGGDFKVSDQLLVQFGLRTEYNKEFTLRSLVPLVNLNWLLKGD